MATNTNYEPATYNTGVVRGDTFNESHTFTSSAPVLRYASVRIQLWSRSGSMLDEFSVGNGIIIDTESDTYYWSIDSDVTAEYPVGTYDFDVEVTVGGSVKTYLTGKFTVKKDVTV